MNYTWKTVYGDQRLIDLARQLRGKSSDSEQEVVDDDADDDADDYDCVNEEYDEEEEEEEDISSSEEEEMKDSKNKKRWNKIWNERFEQSKEYKAQYGHCKVPNINEPNKALGRWVTSQRQQYRKMSKGLSSTMTDEQVEKLESLGFSWVLHSKGTWNERLEELKEYKAQHGHCNVPRKYEPNKALGMWVRTQRTQYNLMSKGWKSSMTDE